MVKNRLLILTHSKFLLSPFFKMLLWVVHRCAPRPILDIIFFAFLPAVNFSGVLPFLKDAFVVVNLSARKEEKNRIQFLRSN